MQPAALPGRVRVVVRPFVLYTHVNALLASKVRIPCHFPIDSTVFHAIPPCCGLQALFAFAKQAPERFVEFTSFVYDNQDKFNKAAGDAKSQSELKAVFAGLVEEFGGDRARFEADVDGEDVLLKVKENQRQGILHAVWSTPTFIINGAEVTSLGSSTSPEDWVKYLTGLLG